MIHRPTIAPYLCTQKALRKDVLNEFSRVMERRGIDIDDMALDTIEVDTTIDKRVEKFVKKIPPYGSSIGHLKELRKKEDYKKEVQDCVAELQAKWAML